MYIQTHASCSSFYMKFVFPRTPLYVIRHRSQYTYNMFIYKQFVHYMYLYIYVYIYVYIYISRVSFENTQKKTSAKLCCNRSHSSKHTHSSNRPITEHRVGRPFCIYVARQSDRGHEGPYHHKQQKLCFSRNQGD